MEWLGQSMSTEPRRVGEWLPAFWRQHPTTQGIVGYISKSYMG